MINIIKNFFSRQKYYLKLVNVDGDVHLLIEFSDIFKLMQKTGEMDVIKVNGEFTLIVGKR